MSQVSGPNSYLLQQTVSQTRYAIECDHDTKDCTFGDSCGVTCQQHADASRGKQLQTVPRTFLELLFQDRFLTQSLQIPALVAVWLRLQMLGKGAVASEAEAAFKCHTECFAACVGLHRQSLQVAFAADRVFYKQLCFLTRINANSRKHCFESCG